MDRRKFLHQTAAAAVLTSVGGITLPSFTHKKKAHYHFTHQRYPQ